MDFKTSKKRKKRTHSYYGKKERLRHTLQEVEREKQSIEVQLSSLHELLRQR